MGKTRKNEDVKNYYRINKKTIINKKRKMTSKLNNLTGKHKNQKGGFFEYFKFLLNLRKFNNIIVKFNKANQKMTKEIDSFKLQMENFKKLAEENRDLSVKYMTNTKTRTLLEIGIRDPKISDRNKNQLEYDLNLSETNYKKINNELMQNQNHLEKEEPKFTSMDKKLKKINDNFQAISDEYAKLGGFRQQIKILRDEYVNALNKKGKTAKKSVKKYQSHKEEYEKVLKMDDLTVQNIKKIKDEINQLQSDAGQFIDRFETIAKDRETKQTDLEKWQQNYNEIFDLINKTIDKTKDALEKMKEILKNVDYLYSMSQVIFKEMEYGKARDTNAIVQMKKTMENVKELITAIGNDTAKLRNDFYEQTPAKLMSYTYTAEQFVTNYAIERLRKYEYEFNSIVKNIGLKKGGAYDVMKGYMIGGLRGTSKKSRKTTKLPLPTPITGDGHIKEIKKHQTDSFYLLDNLLNANSNLKVIIPGRTPDTYYLGTGIAKNEWYRYNDGKGKTLHDNMISHLKNLIDNLIKKYSTRVILQNVGNSNKKCKFGNNDPNMNPSKDIIHVWGANYDNWNSLKGTTINGDGQAECFDKQDIGIFGINTMPIENNANANANVKKIVQQREQEQYKDTLSPNPPTTATVATAPPNQPQPKTVGLDDTKLENIYEAIHTFKGRYPEEVKQVADSAHKINELLKELVKPNGELEELSNDLNKITKIFIELKDIEPRIADIELKEAENVAVKYNWLLKPVKDEYKDFEIMKSTKDIYEKIIKKDLSEDQFKKFDLDDKEALQALVLINQNVDNIVSPILTVFQKIVSSKDNLEKFLKEYWRANNKEPVDKRAGENNCRVMNKLWSLIGADPSKADIRKLIEDEARTDNSKNPHRQACNASTGPPTYNYHQGQGQGQGKRNRGGRKW